MKGLPPSPILPFLTISGRGLSLSVPPGSGRGGHKRGQLASGGRRGKFCCKTRVSLITDEPSACSSSGPSTGHRSASRGRGPSHSLLNSTARRGPPLRLTPSRAAQAPGSRPCPAAGPISLTRALSLRRTPAAPTLEGTKRRDEGGAGGRG